MTLSDSEEMLLAGLEPVFPIWAPLLDVSGEWVLCYLVLCLFVFRSQCGWAAQTDDAAWWTVPSLLHSLQNHTYHCHQPPQQKNTRSQGRESSAARVDHRQVCVFVYTLQVIEAQYYTNTNFVLKQFCFCAV